MAFESFSSRLLGLAVSHVSRADGSALAVEFGDLRASAEGPEGEMGLVIERDWRIEGQGAELLGAEVEQVRLLGEPPRIAVSLSNGLSVSAGTADGEAAWALWDRRLPQPARLTVRGGQVVIELAPTAASVFLKPSPHEKGN